MGFLVVIFSQVNNIFLIPIKKNHTPNKNGNKENPQKRIKEANSQEKKNPDGKNNKTKKSPNPRKKETISQEKIQMRKPT